MDKNRKHEVFRDSHGAISSKRVSGMILLMIGSAELLLTAVLSLWGIARDSATAVEIGKILIVSGVSLLGVGVVEFFAPKPPEVK